MVRSNLAIRDATTTEILEGKTKMGKICTYFGFKNGKLVSVLQSVDKDVKKAIDCTYYITEPQEVEAQIQKWKKEKAQ